MALTEIKIRSAKSKIKPYKLSDGEGLYLLIHSNGSKYWRLKYRIRNKEKVHAIGQYPDISLAEAREKKFYVKQDIKNGIDPNDKKKIEAFEKRLADDNTFESVALEWHKKNIRKWSERQALKLENWINKELVPVFGYLQVNEVKPIHVMQVMKNIESREAYDVARRVLNLCSQIFRYAIPTGRCEYDVTVGLNQTLTYVKRENFKCISVEELPQLLKTIEQHRCQELTKYALWFVLLTFVRTKELRFSKWTEVDLKKKEWRIPAENMKMRRPHVVPLSSQAIGVLKKVQALGLNSEYIFPNENDSQKVMSENTMLFALYDMKYRGKMTVHGFRQLASTVLNEQGFNPDAIERQLSHMERNNVRRAYNHAQYLPERKEMMQWWADYVINSLQKK